MAKTKGPSSDGGTLDAEPSRSGALSSLGDVPRRTAHEEVLERLRKAILGGVLPPGTPLVLSELSMRLGVSRTPIREAIRDLAADRLVDFDAYRSAIVHEPTLAEAREIYNLRLTLEPIAVREAVLRITDAEIEEAATLQREMVAVEDVATWVELNRRFHAVLLDATTSPRLLSILCALRDAAAIQVALSIQARPAQMPDGNKEHARIVEAFRARDAPRAVQLTEQHLRSTLEAIEAYERRSRRDGRKRSAQ